MFVWEGIYKSYADLPVYKEFDSELWVIRQREKLEDVSKNTDKYLIENKLLMSVLQDNASVLDYGGSLGLTYKALKPLFKLNYNIVETKTICDVGKNIFKNEIQFFEKIPTNINSLDVLYIRTALQYAQNWKNDIINLLKLCPQKIVLAHLSSGNIPTYLTLQKWYGTEIPYWFINEIELTDLIESYGYRVINRGFSESIEHWFKKTDGSYSVPSDYVLMNTIDIIFEKIK